MIDEVAVRRAVNGDRRVRLTPAERREVIRVLHSRRWNDQRIARWTGFCPRTVLRHRRHALRLPAIPQQEWGRRGNGRPRKAG